MNSEAPPLTGDRPTAAGHRITWRCFHGDAAAAINARTRAAALTMATVVWNHHRSPTSENGGGCTAPPPAPADDPWTASRAAISLELDRRGIRQTAVAAALGLSTKHISQVLNGATASPATLSRIAKHLGLTFRLSPTSETPDPPG